MLTHRLQERWLQCSFEMANQDFPMMHASPDGLVHDEVQASIGKYNVLSELMMPHPIRSEDRWLVGRWRTFGMLSVFLSGLHCHSSSGSHCSPWCSQYLNKCLRKSDPAFAPCASAHMIWGRVHGQRPSLAQVVSRRINQAPIRMSQNLSRPLSQLQGVFHLGLRSWSILL